VSAPLQFSLQGGVAEILLDDGKVNALSENMLEQLLAAIAKAAEADAALLIRAAPVSSVAVMTVS
tara:strand:+ start:476 stop:670 length:195 start_codon:yes stop_codon:yes gene_type:complete